MPSMEANLKEWMTKYEVKEGDLDKVEEVSFVKASFKDDSITKEDWKHLVEKTPNLVAFAANNCGIKKIESLPNSEDNTLEVLDLSENPLESLDFASSAKGLVSLTLKSCPKLDSVKKLEPLKEHPSLKVVEFDDDNFLGEKSAEEMRKKVFELLPFLMAVNGIDQEGNELEDDDNEEEDWDPEDLVDLEGLTDEQIQGLLEAGEEEEEEEDDEDDDEEEVEGPAAKKQKTQ